MSTVPFGKYKGRPVEQMLADADYMAWLEAQPWFRDRFAHMKKPEAGNLSRTPEHNRFQALFLDLNYAGAFITIVLADYLAECGEIVLSDRALDLEECDKQIARHVKRAEELEAAGINVGYASPDREREAAAKWEACKADLLSAGMGRKSLRTIFEHDGADVYIGLTVSWKALVLGRTLSRVVTAERSKVARVEVKPVVADDYPVVLRQMNRNKSTYLFLGSYTGEGATFAQFVDIFARSGKRIVLKSSVDREAGVA